jgi:hypothetical protein
MVLMRTEFNRRIGQHSEKVKRSATELLRLCLSEFKLARTVDEVRREMA